MNSKRLIEDWIEYCTKILRSNPTKIVTNEVINLAADLIRANSRLKQIPFSQLPLELLIQERCFGKNDGTVVPIAPKNSSENTNGNNIPLAINKEIKTVTEQESSKDIIKDNTENTVEPRIDTKDSILKQVTPKEQITTKKEEQDNGRSFSVIEFIRFIDAYDSVHPALKAIMKKTTFHFHSKKLTISHTNKLEHTKIAEPKNNALLQQILDEFMGISTELEIIFLSKGKIDPNIADNIF